MVVVADVPLGWRALLMSLDDEGLVWLERRLSEIERDVAAHASRNEHAGVDSIKST
jgi:hypothetical protein